MNHLNIGVVLAMIRIYRNQNLFTTVNTDSPAPGGGGKGMSEEKYRCVDCAYWEQVTDEVGECRLRSPIADVERGGRKFAETADVDWCGEFKEA